MPKPFVALPLPCGRTALIDTEDLRILNGWKLSFVGKDHVRAFRKQDRKSVSVYLHRLLLNPKENEEIDHINGNGLDNRRSNLRIVDRFKNNLNRRRPSNNTSGFRGVWRAASGRWCASTASKGKKYHLGTYDSPQLAYKAYVEFHERMNNLRWSELVQNEKYKVGC